MTHDFLPSGHLQITASAETLAFLREKYDSREEAETLDAFGETFEGIFCNTELESVRPEYMGALTGDPFLLGIYGEDTPLPDGAESAFYNIVGAWENEQGVLTTYYKPVEKAWHFPNYALRSPVVDIQDQGYVVFARVPDAD